jgi:uncharacterized protein GlcG (DUF336 family)
MDAADRIASKVIACNRRNYFEDVSVSVVDGGGHIIVQKRMDGCPMATSVLDQAYAKAFTCISQRCSSRDVRDKYCNKHTHTGGVNGDDGNRQFSAADACSCHLAVMINASKGEMMPIPGGVLLLDSVNHRIILGAVGVSGCASSDEDEYCAIQGVIETGLNGLAIRPERHSCTTMQDAISILLFPQENDNAAGTPGAGVDDAGADADTQYNAETNHATVRLDL